MNEMPEEKKRMLKEIIKQLHAGASPQEVKERFRQVLENVSSLEIAKIEEELVKEGMPREEIQKLCDVHMAVFREQLEKQKLTVPIDHPNRRRRHLSARFVVLPRQKRRQTR